MLKKINEADILTERYKGHSWNEISKELMWSELASHTGYYNESCYVVLCDRFDNCIKVCLLEQ